MLIIVDYYCRSVSPVAFFDISLSSFFNLGSSPKSLLLFSTRLAKGV